MRPLILLAGPALFLAACGNDGQAENTINADQGLSAESFSSNDVTAIDAVTGEASNMAADVNFVTELDEDLDAEPGAPARAGTNNSSSSTSARRPSRDRAPSESREPAEPASANTSAAASTNNAL